jgi:tetratricopeptide (TPR) repeat protein
MDSPTASSADAAPLSGERVVFTGRLASMTQMEAADLLRSQGATVSQCVSRSTTLLVVGAGAWPLSRAGRLTRNLQAARWRQRRGQLIEIISEDEFLARAGHTVDPETGLYSVVDLLRLAKVSRERLRRWIESGLVRPVEQRGQVAYFDFRQVSRVRSLLGLVQSGVTVRRLRRSLCQIERWLPDAHEACECVSNLERYGARLVFETDAGQLIEPGGQLVFRFGDGEPEPETVPFIREVCADELFGLAVRHEGNGELVQAIAAYQRLLSLEGPDAEVCFNLANALYATGQIDAAIDRYHEATCLDPLFLEAWNNLGNALSEQGRRREAIAALQHAVSIDPDYADAQCSLADVLEESGAAERARPHWESYLRLEPTGDWADHARERLSATRRSGSA